MQVEAVQSAVLAVNEAAHSLWPHSRTALFGSQVRRSMAGGGGSVSGELAGRGILCIHTDGTFMHALSGHVHPTIMPCSHPPTRALGTPRGGR